ncbi:LOW QUALITY PROTEIN: hypothetical protein RJ640_029780 [Escallonia rubra]|uniref:Protein kinase domain-containing protein n=1 Tax=Escallonia rubra TaxID=112253 RepID=A0AA88QGZ2_9ASTE|nr:LOW QUALITY PROTEIN: hypothetical protein RJ640_029780 [Escallonia rubra]
MSACDGSPSTSSSPSRQFSLADIQSATDNFSEELVIGRGGFGKVYKGSITDREGMTVAVKRLNPRSRQGAREFRTEIEMLSRFRYRYLVSLIGYCEEPDEMILVYEYMPRGNFADHLHRSGKNYSAPLPWLRRLRICIGASRGLDYLHTGTSIQPDRAIHRDVKTSNFLLDNNREAKIVDFGLCRLGPEDQTYSHVSTEIANECLHNFPRRRPTMAEVVVRLEFALAMQEGKDTSIVVKPAKMPLTLQEGEDSSDVVKPAKMTFPKKVQQYFLRVSGSSDTKPSSKVERKYNSVSNSILPDKDGGLSNKDGVVARELPSGGQTLTPSFKQFTFSELKIMSKNFNREKGFHVVAFKGWIDGKMYNPSKVGVRRDREIHLKCDPEKSIRNKPSPGYYLL